MKFERTITVGDAIKIVSVIVLGLYWTFTVNWRLSGQDDKIANLVTASTKLAEGLADERNARFKDENNFTELRTIVNDRLNIKQ